MKAIVLAVTITMLAAGSASAADYCLKRYETQIGAASAELGAALQRTDEINDRIGVLIQQQTDIIKQVTDELAKPQPDLQLVSKLGDDLAVVVRERDELEAEAYGIQDRITLLKTSVPAGLQGELRGCVEASASAQSFVNLTLQALLLATSGAGAFVIPEKSIHVDMQAVIAGYPFGGDNSVLNQARDEALKGLGIGGTAKDIIKDPIGGTVCKLLSC
jgi:hypothetical protein